MYIIILLCPHAFSFFFFNDTATTEIYTLSLHDALPISRYRRLRGDQVHFLMGMDEHSQSVIDRKSTRLNSSHDQISYAVFCLKKKKKERLVEILRDALLDKARAQMSDGDMLRYAAEVADHRRDPYALIEEIVENSAKKPDQTEPM